MHNNKALQTMKVHKLHIILLVSILSLFSINLSAQLPGSGTWGTTSLSTAYPNDKNPVIELTGDINIKGTITINSGYTLTIKNGTDQLRKITKTAKSSTLFKVNDGGKLIITGEEDKEIHIDCGGNLTWDNYTLTEGEGSLSTNHGIENKGELLLEHVHITDFKNSSSYHGAIFAASKKGTTVLKHCIIERCVSGAGCAIMIQNGEAANSEVSKIVVENSTITKCITGNSGTDNSGGAIRTLGNVQSDLYLTKVTFSYNYAMRNKGFDNTLEKNGNGGALFWNGRGYESTACYIDGCTFEYNKCDDNGGAIKAQGSLKFINNPTYIRNNSAPKGGGIFIEGYTGSVKIYKPANLVYDLDENLVIENNTSAHYEYGGEIYHGKGAGIHFDFGPKMTLDANSVVTVRMDGAIIRNNKVEGDNGLGGGIFYEDKSPAKNGYTFNIYLNSGNVNNNTATGKGGGIYISKGNVTYDKTTGSPLAVSDNKAVNGGGIYVKDGNLEIANGTISSNTLLSEGDGAGIYVDNGDFTINAGSINGNIVSKGSGAGVYVNNGDFTMNGGSISANSSSGNGGGVYINGGKFEQNAGSINGNWNSANGGGVCIVNGGTFTMNAGKIENNGKNGNNATSVNGGGVYLNGGNFVLTNGTISGNGATGNGGGVFLTGENCKYELKKGDITGNSASNGGGVYLEKGLFTLGNEGNSDDGNISGNSAAKGGGVYIGSADDNTFTAGTEGSSTSEGFVMLGGNIKENRTSGDGGGVYLQGGGFTQKNGTIQLNESNTDGGGVYLNGGNLNVQNGKILGNRSVNYGGGIYILNGAVDMGKGFIESNHCNQYGGGVYVYNNTDAYITVNFSGGTLTRNSALYGGGICVNGKIYLNIGNIEIAENSATNGGGVCLMNEADMRFGSGQIKNNTASKSENAQYYTGVTAFGKGIAEVEGIGGGVYLDSHTKLTFDANNNLGLFGNRADNGGDELFANGNGTTVNIPDVTNMKLDGYAGAENLKWIEDYITDDTGYLQGTNLLGYASDAAKTENLRYREMINRNMQNIPHLAAGIATDDERAQKYISFALGYEIIYITITKSGLKKDESAIFTLSKDGAAPFRIIITGTGADNAVSKRVALTAGEWTITETDWSWSYSKNPDSITKNIADENNRLFEFANQKSVDNTNTLHHESKAVKIMGGTATEN